ncbi:MAG TPA: PorT family protein [Candidatus Bacteroides pullicola]|uniref:PorT family protein n=1 Tax=Candidatus Bacteroides pullicola TaxID=2838475 RepID=A0A9D1ZGM6_9BACE|nr:PorT family protein [Candidatus Bacteroides pullicola]
MKTKILATLCLLLFTGHALHAQVGEQRYNFAIGVNGGINMNKVSFTPTVNQKNLMGINAGLTARYISEKYFNMICGAQLEVNFSQRGWDEFYEYTPDVHYTRTMNYVEIPFLAHLAFGKERGLQFFLNLGPQIGFLISDSEQQTGDMNEVIADNPIVCIEQQGKPIDNKFDYGITGGIGAELRTKFGNFLVEGRYYFGLADFYNSTKKDYFSRSANGGFMVKATYLFDVSK